MGTPARCSPFLLGIYTFEPLLLVSPINSRTYINYTLAIVHIIIQQIKAANAAITPPIAITGMLPALAVSADTEATLAEEED